MAEAQDQTVMNRKSHLRKRQIKQYKIEDISDQETDEEQDLKKKSRKRKGKTLEKVPAKRQKKTKSVKSAKWNPEMEFKDVVAKWERAASSGLKVEQKLMEVFSGQLMYCYFDFKDGEDEFLVHFDGEKPWHPYRSSRYKVTLEADVPILEDKLLMGTMDKHNMETMFGLIGYSLTEEKIMEEFSSPHVPPTLLTIQQPKEILLTLKDYQLRNVAWMVDLEQNIDREWEVSKLIKWKQIDSDCEFDLRSKRVFFPPIPKNRHTVMKMKSKGGILADEMGLGKTITLLALFASNAVQDTPTVPDPDNERFLNELALPTKATLVVAPSHLACQWKYEAADHAPDLNVILITTKHQFENVSYVGIMAADIVIVSEKFLLSNKVFTSLPSGRSAESDFMNFLRQPGQNPLLQKCPNFAHFCWWRIVCDESHELLPYDIKRDRRYPREAESKGLAALSKLKSRYRWYVSGTPFPHGERSLRSALKFLQVSVDDPYLMQPDGTLDLMQERIQYNNEDNFTFLHNLYRVFLNNYYIRNSKESIGAEYDVPEYVEELILLTMSDVEKGIYDRAKSEKEKRQICCHLQIGGLQQLAGVQQKSLEEVKVILLEHTKEEIKRYQRLRENTEKSMQKVSGELDDEVVEYKRNQIARQIDNYLRDIEQYDKELANNQSAVNYFESIVPRITHSEEEPCVICLDVIENLTVTPCGHLYCQCCIVPCVQQQGKCPTCRKNIKENQLLEIKDEKTRDELEKQSELFKLTEEYGTKMAYLIFYLRHLFRDDSDSRVIIFSQWDALLHMIGETLAANDITNTYVKGNIHCREKAIWAFRKQEKTRVIMLSLEHAASGTNLVEATHVILIDPVAGSKEEAIAVETQAIGRAHRMGQHKQISIVRMIMKDTIEHTLYQRNNSEQVKQVEFNFDQNSGFGPQVIRTQIAKVPDEEMEVASTSSRDSSSRRESYNSSSSSSDSDSETGDKI